MKTRAVLAIALTAYHSTAPLCTEIPRAIAHAVTVSKRRHDAPEIVMTITTTTTSF